MKIVIITLLLMMPVIAGAGQTYETECVSGDETAGCYDINKKEWWVYYGEQANLEAWHSQTFETRRACLATMEAAMLAMEPYFFAMERRFYNSDRELDHAEKLWTTAKAQCWSK